MAANIVVFFSKLETGQKTVFGGAHGAVVNANFFGERSCLPPLHTRCQNGNHVNPAALDRRVTTDHFETLAAKKLASTRNMLNAAEAEIIGSFTLTERRAGNT